MIYFYYNFGSTLNLNEKNLEYLNRIPTSLKLFECLLNWLIGRMKSFNGFQDTWFSLLLTRICTLVSSCISPKG